MSAFEVMGFAMVALFLGAMVNGSDSRNAR
jgi:hypothetical protein